MKSWLKRLLIRIVLSEHFTARVLCELGEHDWNEMTAGRGMFVHWDRCIRGCGEQRMRKGSW